MKRHCFRKCSMKGIRAYICFRKCSMKGIIYLYMYIQSATITELHYMCINCINLVVLHRSLKQKVNHAFSTHQNDSRKQRRSSS